jgi:hypothetical protein
MRQNIFVVIRILPQFPHTSSQNLFLSHDYRTGDTITKLYYNLYSSPTIIRIIKSKRMRWAGHKARMGTKGMHRGYWWEIQKERHRCEDQDVRGWTILKWILER